MYTVKILHPNAQAEFSLTVYAKSKAHAYMLAYCRINDRFGAGTYYLIGEVTKA